MALITNNISGSTGGAQDTRGRSIIALTGSSIFMPHQGDGPAKGLQILAPDAAYIFSGTQSGNDKTVFFGDVVVSGTLDATVVGGVDGTGASNRVVVWVDADTVDSHANFVWDDTDLFLGAGNTDTTKLKFQNSGLAVGASATNEGGLIGAADFHLLLSGAIVNLSGSGAGNGQTGGVRIGGDIVFTGGTGTRHELEGGFIELEATQTVVDIEGKQGISLKEDGSVILNITDARDIISTNTRQVHLDASGVVNINSSAGIISIGNDDIDQNINIGTQGERTVSISNGAFASTLNLGNATGASALVAKAGTGGVDLDSTGKINLATTNANADAVIIDASVAGGGIDITAGNAANDAGSDISIIAMNKLTIDAQGTDSGDGVEITLGADDANAKFLVRNDSAAAALTVDGLLDVVVGRDLVVTRNVEITGNLDVNGTTTTIDSENVQFTDSVIGLGLSGSDDTFTNIGDRGIIFARGLVKNSLPAIKWDGSKFELGKYNSLPVSGGLGTASSFVTLKAGNFIGNLSGDVTGTTSLVTVTDSTANTDFPIVFNDESNALLDDTAAFEYNPSTGNLTVPKVTCDDVTVDGKIITMVGSTDDTAVFTVGTNGTLDITTTDTAAAAANMTLTADGVFEAVGTSIILDSGADIELEATGDVNLPANIGLTFGDDGEKIEGDGTDLTVTSGNNINLTATADVVVPANVGVTFGTGEKIEGDNTDLTVTSGAKINLTAVSDVHLPNDVGMVYGDAGEKIEGDGSRLTISAANIDFVIEATGDIAIPANIGLEFGSGEKIEGNNTDLTLTSGAKIVLAAVGNIEVGHHVVPDADNTLDLGSAAARFRNIYTGDLNLRNDRGDWTLIEEEDFLSFRNNVTGRRFRMVMEDITGLGNYGPGNDGEM
jgi:hypothetical protein